MKQLIYLTYLGLLVLILVSCQKENVVPAGTPEELTNADTQRTASTCASYSFYSKDGLVPFGNMRNDYIIVGFKPFVDLAQQQAILSAFPIYNTTDGDAAFALRTATVVKLDPGTTCSQIHVFSKQLEKNPAVDLVLPVLDGLGVYSNYEWITSSSEILVFLTDPAHYSFLEQLTRKTRTRIVDSWDDVTFIIESDKNSHASVLELSSILNASSKVASAEPLIFGEFGFNRQILNQPQILALTTKE